MVSGKRDSITFSMKPNTDEGGDWIYGHSHRNRPNFLIGQTELRTNQLGYVFKGEQRRFDGGLVVDLAEAREL